MQQQMFLIAELLLSQLKVWSNSKRKSFSSRQPIWFASQISKGFPILPCFTL